MKHIGIDISKGSFWASTGGAHKEFKQCKAGFKAFLKWMAGLGVPGAVAVMEATGVYHLRLAVFLSGEGVAVAVVNPQRPYHHGKSQMARVSTDASAARNIADFAAKNQVEGGWKPMPDQVEQLRWWLKQADRLCAAVTACLNQIESLRMRPADTCDRVRHLEDRIARLKAEQRECEGKAEAIAAGSYKDERELFQSIPGVGPKTSLALVAFFCSHYRVTNPRQALVLAGLSLRRHSSGTSVHKKEKITKMGYGYLRKCLYMAALRAVQDNPACKALYDKLVAKGKLHKVALVAVACKLLRQAFAVWNTGQPFDVQKSKENFARKSATA
jgi:transposase